MHTLQYKDKEVNWLLLTNFVISVRLSNSPVHYKRNPKINESKIMAKYRFVNQTVEYELLDKYLGWFPKGFADWEGFRHEYSSCDRESRPKNITLVSPSGKKTVVLNLDKHLTREAFPMSFFGEQRAVLWWHFLLVSKKETPKTKFIIPMH